MKHPSNFVDRTGKVYGLLTVIGSAGFSQALQRTVWNCKCECGNSCVIQGKLLANGTTRSCGCLKKVPRSRLDLTGRQFRYWSVVKFFDNGLPGKKVSRFLCRCICGVEKIVQGGVLTSGKSQSCGCKTSQIISEKNSTHGDTSGGRTKEYRAWKSMRDRCFLRSAKCYRIYGGRGITVCKRWLKFENFLADMGRAPSPSHQLDRFPNNNGNYEPSNCRWTDAKSQSRNRRTNVLATHDGVTKCCLDWAAELKIPRWTVARRLKIGRTIYQIKREFS